MHLTDDQLDQLTEDQQQGLTPERALDLVPLLLEDLKEARAALDPNADGDQGEGPIKQTVQLGEEEWLGDRPPVIQGLRVIIEGETGIGKTGYVLDELANAYRVVLLLPTIGQVRQIESNSAGRDLHFVHGKAKPDRLDGTIVATYDQLGYIARVLGEERSECLLVVDEVHKLYQAGGYRALALQGILDAIAGLGKAGGFGGMIGLSATIQPELLDFPIDQWIVVEKAGAKPRRIVVVEYDDVEEYVGKLIADELLLRGALNVIRLNHTKRLGELAELFRARGYSCTVVHSKVQDEEEVQQILESESVGERDILLTTSLLDEGINIKNVKLGYVHLIGSVHSAELRQFLGRFRGGNPLVYVHVAQLPKQAEAWDIAAERAYLRNVQAMLVGFCRAVLQHGQAPRRTPTEGEVRHYVQKLNVTHRHWCEFDLVLARPVDGGRWEVIANRPGLLAYLYGLDTSNHYLSLDALEGRLRDQFPGSELYLDEVAKQGFDEALQEDLRAAAAVVDEQRLALMTRIENRLECMVTEDIYGSPETALRRLARDVLYERTAEASMIRALWHLASEVAADYETALRILRDNQQDRASRFAQALDDELVREFHRVLDEYRQRTAPGHDGPLKVPREDGTDLVVQALVQLSDRNPQYHVSTLLLGSKKRGVSRNDDGSYDVTAQFVTKLFRDYTDSDAEKHYYRFRSLAWGGYRYARFAAPPPPMESAAMPKRRSQTELVVNVPLDEAFPGGDAK